MAQQKLIKKSGANTVMDIATRLRQGTEPLTVLEASEDKHDNNEIPENKTLSHQEEVNSLEDILSILKDKNYKFSDPIKIDADVKEVFRLMKVNAKIPISSLISYILEEWICNHEDDIKHLIKHKKNRLL